MIEKLRHIENYLIQKKNGNISSRDHREKIVCFLMIRLNIGHRLESVSTPTIINDTATPLQRLKRPRLEVIDSRLGERGPIDVGLVWTKCARYGNLCDAICQDTG